MVCAELASIGPVHQASSSAWRASCADAPPLSINHADNAASHFILAMFVSRFCRGRDMANAQGANTLLLAFEFSYRRMMGRAARIAAWNVSRIGSYTPRRSTGPLSGYLADRYPRGAQDGFDR